MGWFCRYIINKREILNYNKLKQTNENVREKSGKPPYLVLLLWFGRFGEGPAPQQPMESGRILNRYKYVELFFKYKISQHGYGKTLEVRRIIFWSRNWLRFLRAFGAGRVPRAPLGTRVPHWSGWHSFYLWVDQQIETLCEHSWHPTWATHLNG